MGERDGTLGAFCYCCCCCSLYPVEEPIYEEMNPMPTGSEAVEEQIYEEMNPQPIEREIAEETIYEEMREPPEATCSDVTHDDGGAATVEPSQGLLTACKEYHVSLDAVCEMIKSPAPKGRPEDAPTCVTVLIPALDNYDVDPRVFEDIVTVAHSRVWGGCCSYCAEIAYCQEHSCLGKSYSTEDEDSSDSDEEASSSDEVEKMGDSGVDTTDDTAEGMKEPPPSRAQTPEPPRGGASIKDEEEMRACVQTLLPDVWDSTIDFNILASSVHADINPACCWRCGFITLAKEISGLKVLEIKAETPYIFLKVTECAGGEKQKHCEENSLMREDDGKTRKSI
ncbi:uncharacterized protein LOC143840699 [Paroedura picta]|uniref:uncharacterized protein LOC143840699 n=1 Tax=Paroedura picta TaxID=143630 RepID=UPI0040579531